MTSDEQRVARMLAWATLITSVALTILIIDIQIKQQIVEAARGQAKGQRDLVVASARDLVVDDATRAPQAGVPDEDGPARPEDSAADGTADRWPLDAG